MMTASSVRRSRPSDGDTRHQVLDVLLKLGPVTANDLGCRLGLSAAGVRRHLDILVKEGFAETVDRPPTGRGRPARHFRLTDAGRDQFGHDYDSLASEALSALRAVGGSEAVRAFARRRIEGVLDGVEPARDTSDDAIEMTTRRLAEAFDRRGYAVTVTRAGRGIQLCQHHCPVASVAAEHPELCEAELEVIAERVRLHVQPLASITDGHGLCTTNIPLTPVHHEERSES